MSIGWSRYITQRTVLRVIQTGFALVLLLLGMACVIAVQGTHAIQLDAETLLREELTVARLLNEVQAEETTLTAVLHRLTDRKSAVDRTLLLRELDETDHAVTRASRAAQASPEAAHWRELDATAKRFTAMARTALNEKERAGATVQSLFAMHDSVVGIVQDLVAVSTTRAIHVDHLLTGRSQALADESVVLLGACFVLALLCAGLTVYMTRATLKRVESQATELGRVSWHMLETQEESARRFSHELHDELGQSLAAIRANITSTKASDFETRRGDCLHLVDEAIANVRELSQLLRPVILDDFGLDAALRWLTEKFSQRTNILVRYDSTLQVRLEDQSETHLFRIAQEALTNVARHSQATEVHIGLNLQGRTVSLVIEDNGRGLSSIAGSGARSTLGMTGMRARARQAGGELTVESPHGGGVRICAEVPVSEHEYAAW
ncbi:MAG: sensor histidine kinase [Bryobacteraceae bacterium]